MPARAKLTLKTEKPNPRTQNREPKTNPMTPITLTYTLEREDHLALALHTVRTDFLQRRRTQINRIVLALALALWMIFLARVFNFSGLVGVALLSAGMGILGYWLYPRLVEAAIRQQTTAFYNRNPGARGEQTLTLTETELTGRSSKSEVRFELSAVQRLEQSPTHLFVMLGENNVIIVPKRAFSSAEEQKQFVVGVSSRA